MEIHKTCIIVLGTPGSGSSVLANCIKMLGADPGGNIIFPDSGNGKHFINRDIRIVHDILLRDLGSRPDMIGNLTPHWQTSPAANTAKTKIKSILENNFSRDRLWIVNDSRICRFLPLWLTVLDEMKVSPGLIYNIRHPVENALSLADRTDIPFRKALLLWLSLYRDAFSTSRNIPFTISTFDQLLADPLFTLKRIRRSLSIEYPVPLQKAHTDILGLILPEMKHHHYDPATRKEHAGFDHYNLLYEQIRLLNIDRTGQLPSENNQDKTPVPAALPAVLQNTTAENVPVETFGSSRDKSALLTDRLFNDMLVLIGDHERENQGRKIALERKLIESSSRETILSLKLLFPKKDRDRFTEDKSQDILLAPGEWQEIIIPLSESGLFRTKGLKLRPLNVKGIVDISAIKLLNPAVDEEVYTITTREQFNDLSVSGGAFKIPDSNSLILLIYSNTPELVIPPCPDLPDCPLELHIWIKPETDLTKMKKVWEEARSALEELGTEKKSLKADLAVSREKLSAEQHERERIKSSCEELKTNLSSSEKDLASSKAELNQVKINLNTLASEKETLSTELNQKNNDLSALAAEKNNLEVKLNALSEELENTATLLTAKESRCQLLETDKKELIDRLNAQKLEIGKIQDELSAVQTDRNKQQGHIHSLTAEISELQSDREMLNKKARQNGKWMRQLENDLNALLDSKRWQTGNFLIRMLEIILLKGRSGGAPQHMREIFESFHSSELPSPVSAHTEASQEQFNIHPNLSYDGLMRLLEKDINAFAASARWKVGHTIIGLIEKLLLRGRSRLALDHMQDIFKEYKDITAKWAHVSPEMKNRWLRHIKSDVNDLMLSKRWQIGDRLVRLAEITLLRKKQPMAVDHIRALLKQYDSGSMEARTNIWDDQPVTENYNLSEPAFPDETEPVPEQTIAWEAPLTETSPERFTVLLVSHSRINSNSGYHVRHYAQQLSRQGISCIIAVPEIESGDKTPDNPCQVFTYEEISRPDFYFPEGKAPDIVHAWTPREHVRKFCEKLSDRYTFKTMIHLEDNEEYLTETSLDRPWTELEQLPLKKLDSLIPENRFHPIRGREWLKKADGLTLITEPLQRFNPGNLPCVILPPPVDENLFYPRPINYELRNKLNVPEDHIVLCYTGDVRAPKRKDVLELYKAVALLNKQGHPTTIIRTGTNFVPLDTDDAWYRDFEKPLGWVSRQEVPDVMAAADILVQPGRPGPFDDERIPAKLPEYFAMGRPVILPKTNLGLLARHFEEAYVLNNADNSEIAKTVLEISRKRDLSEKLANGAVDFYLSKFAGNNASEQLNNHYTDILNRPAETNIKTLVITTPDDNPASYSYADLLGSFKHMNAASEFPQQLQDQMGADVTVIPCVETALLNKNISTAKDWIGFVNSVPARLPDWLSKQPPYNYIANHSLFTSTTWQQTKSTCKALYVRSEDHANQLKQITDVPVHSIRLPLPEVNRKWSPEAFKNNPDKKIIQIGWWMQRPHAIYILPVQNMQKVWIRGNSPDLDKVIAVEEQHLTDRYILFDFMLNTVKTIDFPGAQQFEQTLSENIVFSHYYDANCLDLLFTCIASHTPILINPHISVREYLGNDYSLYYYSYNDADKKTSDFNRVQKAHEQMIAAAEKHTKQITRNII